MNHQKAKIIQTPNPNQPYNKDPQEYTKKYVIINRIKIMNEIRFNQPINQSEKIDDQKDIKSRSVFGFLKSRRFWFFVISVIVVCSLGLALNFYLKTEKLQSEIKLIGSSDTQEIINEVSKIIILPTGEEPRIVTISDVSSLQSQPFFVNAKNGDKVLIYSQAQKAIIYDPIGKKIVEVASLSAANK